MVFGGLCTGLRSPAISQDSKGPVCARVMAQVGEMLGGAADTTGTSLRADVVQPSLDRAVVMTEAPESDGRFFKVPKVIER